MQRTDIFVAGVGGQGSLTASRLLGEAAMRAGLKVVGAEIHGMAQRGGIVTSTVRIGDVFGPIVSARSAHIVLGFEPVETLRAMEWARPDAIVVTGTRPIVPAGFSLQGERYPEVLEVLRQIRASAGRVIALDILEIANKVGAIQCANSAMLGALGATRALPFESGFLFEAIAAGVKASFVDANRRAFDQGAALAAEQLA